MIDATFTARESTYIFVRTNLADELYAADSPSDDEATCTCEEFELMVARLAREKIPRSSEPFAQTLDAFLSLVFVPTYRTVLKRKGIVVPLAPKADTKRES